MPQTQHTFCRICEALCGLEIDVEDGRVTAIRPDEHHVGTEGYACIKGLRQHELYGSPDRLTQPMKRVGDRHVPIAWEQALAEISAKVKSLRAVSPQSIAMYVGTAAGFGVLHPIFAQGFMDGIGSHNMFASASQARGRGCKIIRRWRVVPSCPKITPTPREGTMTRKLAASFIVTVGLAACSSPAPEPETPHRNPPKIVVPPPDHTPETEPTVTENPPPPEEPTTGDAPKERGRITIDASGKCSWQSTTTRDAPQREVLCPPILTTQGIDPLMSQMVHTNDDGTCHTYEPRKSSPCPRGVRCNPPPPRRIDVACAPE